VALNIVAARAELFGGLITTDSDNVGGRDQGSGLGVGARWALLGAGVERGDMS